MSAQRQLAGRTIAGLLLIVMAAACSRFLGPHLHIDSADGPKGVTVTVDSSGPGMTGGEDVKVPARLGMAWRVPRGSTWEVKVDGQHVIGSSDRTDLACRAPNQRQDVMITIRIRPDGTVKLLEACLGKDHVAGRCAAQ